MIHPSYADLMEVVNSGVEEGEQPVINSRYSIVMATSKRARQIIAGDEPLTAESRYPLPWTNSIRERFRSSVMRKTRKTKPGNCKRPFLGSIVRYPLSCNRSDRSLNYEAKGVQNKATHILYAGRSHRQENPIYRKMTGAGA